MSGFASITVEQKQGGTYTSITDACPICGRVNAGCQKLTKSATKTEESKVAINCYHQEILNRTRSHKDGVIDSGGTAWVRVTEVNGGAGSMWVEVNDYFGNAQNIEFKKAKNLDLTSIKAKSKAAKKANKTYKEVKNLPDASNRELLTEEAITETFEDIYREVKKYSQTSEAYQIAKETAQKLGLSIAELRSGKVDFDSLEKPIYKILGIDLAQARTGLLNLDSYKSKFPEEIKRLQLFRKLENSWKTFQFFSKQYAISETDICNLDLRKGWNKLRDNLSNRGLDDREIEDSKCFPWNGRISLLLKSLKKENKITIPKIFPGWNESFKGFISVEDAIACPALNLDGEILGIQFRHYVPTGKDKRRYTWLSSNSNKDFGFDGKETSPIGYYEPKNIYPKNANSVMILEGFLKPNIASVRQGIRCLGTPALNFLGDKEKHLFDTYIEYCKANSEEPEKFKVLLVPDAGDVFNTSVSGKIIKLATYLESKGYRVEIIWYKQHRKPYTDTEKRLKGDADEISAKVKNLGKRKFISLKEFTQLAHKCGCLTEIEKRFKADRDSISFVENRKDWEYFNFNSRYLGDKLHWRDWKYGLFGIKSDMGTGKTVTLKELVELNKDNYSKIVKVTRDTVPVKDLVRLNNDYESRPVKVNGSSGTISLSRLIRLNKGNKSPRIKINDDGKTISLEQLEKLNKINEILSLKFTDSGKNVNFADLLEINVNNSSALIKVDDSGNTIALGELVKFNLQNTAFRMNDFCQSLEVTGSGLYINLAKLITLWNNYPQGIIKIPRANRKIAIPKAITISEKNIEELGHRGTQIIGGVTKFSRLKQIILRRLDWKCRGVVPVRTKGKVIGSLRNTNAQVKVRKTLKEPGTRISLNKLLELNKDNTHLIPYTKDIKKVTEAIGDINAVRKQKAKNLVEDSQVIYAPIKTLLVGSRNSLLVQTCEVAGLTHIKDIHEAKDKSAIALCIDSLLKIKLDDIRGACLAIDEAESVINHLLIGGTCARKRTQLYQRLKQICRIIAETGGKIVLMDANLSARTLKFFEALTAGVENFPKILIHNTYYNPKTKWDVTVSIGGAVEKFTETGASVIQVKKTDTSHVSGHILAELKKKNNLFVISDSKTEATALHRMLEVMGYKGLLITRDTVGEEAVKDFLTNPEEWLNDNAANKGKKQGDEYYRVVICSPTVESGLSVTGDFFSEVVGVFYGNTSNAEKQMQMLGRVRANCPRFVWIQEFATGVKSGLNTDDDPRSNKSFDPSRLEEDIILETMRTLGELREEKDKWVNLITNPVRLSSAKQLMNPALWRSHYLKATSELLAAENWNKSNLRRELLQRLEEKQHRVKVVDEIRVDNDLASAKADAKEEVVVEESELISNADKITIQTARDLKDSDKAQDPVIYRKITRAYLQEDLPEVDLDPELVRLALLDKNGEWLKNLKKIAHIQDTDTLKKLHGISYTFDAIAKDNPLLRILDLPHSATVYKAYKDLGLEKLLSQEEHDDCTKFLQLAKNNYDACRRIDQNTYGKVLNNEDSMEWVNGLLEFVGLEAIPTVGNGFTVNQLDSKQKECLEAYSRSAKSRLIQAETDIQSRITKINRDWEDEQKEE